MLSEMQQNACFITKKSNHNKNGSIHKTYVHAYLITLNEVEDE